MANATKGRPGRNGQPIRDWRPRTARLLADQLQENDDRLDGGLVSEEQAKVREFAIWESARSAGDDVVTLLKALLGEGAP